MRRFFSLFLALLSFSLLLNTLRIGWSTALRPPVDPSACKPWIVASLASLGVSLLFHVLILWSLNRQAQPLAHHFKAVGLPSAFSALQKRNQGRTLPFAVASLMLQALAMPLGVPPATTTQSMGLLALTATALGFTSGTMILEFQTLLALQRLVTAWQTPPASRGSSGPSHV